MASSDNPAIEQINQLLKCSVCLDRYNNPKILPCQHTFCKSPCLEGLIDRAARTIKCPECRAEHYVPRNGLDCFPTNITIQGFLDLPTTVLLRETVAAAHDHGDVRKCMVCEVEGETMKCFHCNKMVCSGCKTSHSGQLKMDVSRLVSQVRRALPRLSKVMASSEAIQESVKRQANDVKSEINNTIERCIKEIRVRHSQLDSEVEAFLQGELRTFRLYSENAEVTLASISSYCDSMDTFLSIDVPTPEVDLVNMRHQCGEYMKQINDMETEQLPTQRSLRFEYNHDTLHASIVDFGEVKSGNLPPRLNGETPALHTDRGHGMRRARWGEETPGRSRNSWSELHTAISRENHASSNNDYRRMHPTQTGQSAPPATNYQRSPLLPSRGVDYLEVMDTNMSNVGELLQQMTSEESVRRREDFYRQYYLELERFRSQRELLESSHAAVQRQQWQTNTDIRNAARQRNTAQHINLFGGSTTGGELLRHSTMRPPVSSLTSEDHQLMSEISDESWMDVDLSSPPPPQRHAAPRGRAQTLENQAVSSINTVPPSRGRRGRGRQARNNTQPFQQASSAPVLPNSTTTALLTTTTVLPTSSLQNSVSDPVDVAPAPSTSTANTNNSAVPAMSRARTFIRDQPSSENVVLPQVGTHGTSFSIDFDSGAVVYNPPNNNYSSRGTNERIIGGQRGNECGQFVWPRGVAVSPISGNIVVADSSNHRVQVFSSDGSFISMFGSYGQEEGELDSPAGVAVGPSGQIIVADRYNHRIQVFDAGGQFLLGFGSEGSTDGHFSNPWGVACNAAGIVYICDKLNHRIQVFNLDGTFIRKFGSKGNQAGKFENPHYVAVTANRVIVSDGGHHKLQIFTDSGNFIRTIGMQGSGAGQLRYPKGIAIDSSGNVIVADSGNSRVQIFDLNGNYKSHFGSAGSGDDQFRGIEGLAVTTQGKIVVADKDSHRIVLF